MLPRGSSFRLIARQEKHVRNCKVGWIAARTVDALYERIDANETIQNRLDSAEFNTLFTAFFAENNLVLRRIIALFTAYSAENAEIYP